MLSFTGKKSFTLPSQALWEKLNQVEFLVSCLPDLDKVLSLEPTAAKCRLRPGFSFVRGTLDLSLQIAESEPTSHLRYLLSTKGIGTSSKVTTQLRFTPTETGTDIDWQAEVQELGGLLKAVPSGLVQSAAQKILTDAWTLVEQKLA